MNQTVTFKYDKFFKDEIVLDEAVESEMYEQLIKNCARSIDIDFAKTPLVDLITGYQRNKILDSRIDKAIEVLKLCNSECSKEVIAILRGGERK